MGKEQGHQIYIIDRIIDTRVRNGQLEYKVKWQGYSIQESTWEPAYNLKGAQDIIASFQAKISSNKNEEDNFVVMNEFDSNPDSSYNESIENNSKLYPMRLRRRRNVKPAMIPYKKVGIRTPDKDLKTKSIRIQKTPRKTFSRKLEPKQLIKKKRQLTNLPSCPSTGSRDDQSEESYRDSQSSSEEFTAKKQNQQRKYSSTSSSSEKSSSMVFEVDQKVIDQESIASSPGFAKSTIKGSFRQGCLPKEILNIKKDVQNKNVDFYLSWNQRKNGKYPDPSWVNQEEMIENAPLLLSKYLLSKIQWVK